MNCPELNGLQWVAVEMRLEGQTNWRRGMYYLSGGRGFFVSYGSDVTTMVVEWRYDKI